MQINKKTIVRTALLAVLVGALGYSFAAKSETKLLPFQGKLTDANGQVIEDKAIVVQFKMYDAPVGGNAKWNGEVQMLSVNSGLVNTTLGTKASLKNVDFSTPTYLEITIDANGDNQIGPEDPPLLPRQSIIPAVYAVQAGDARTLSGYDWSSIFGTNNPTGKIPGNKLADGSVTEKQIGKNAVTASQIKAGAVTTDKIADKAIKSDKIDDGAVNTAQLFDGAVTTNKIANGAITTEKIATNSITMELMKERKKLVASETAAEVGSMAISKTLDSVVGYDGYKLNAISPNREKLPGMSVKLKTSGRPVMIMLQRGEIDSASCATFWIKRDDTDIYWTNVGHWVDARAGTICIPSSAIAYVDMDAAAGEEHEYSILGCKSESSNVYFYGGMYLVAFEL